MKAITYLRYGSPDVLEFEEVEAPVPGDDGVLVRVQAASVNPLDWHRMRGTPYVLRLQAGLRRPKTTGLGADVAGRVEAVGANVTTFRPGDEVFGGTVGSLAEHVAVRATALAPKPVGLTFEQAAAVPVAGITALQGLRDKGRIRAGQRVLINGASGGVGTFAVQIAKALGAEVTGVCSTRNVELVASLGADEVIDYTQEDFTRAGQTYDLIVDAVGNRPLRDLRRALGPEGHLVLTGAPKGQWLGPITGPLRALLLSRFSGQNLVPFLANVRSADLATLGELLESGSVTPVIDRTYPLAEAADAIRYLEDGHARGKVVVTV